MSERYRKLSEDEAQNLAGEPWQVNDDGLLVASFKTGNMTTGLELVNKVVAEAEAASHHPDIDFRYGRVSLALTTHAVGQLTDADTSLAQVITRLARALAVPAES